MFRQQRGQAQASDQDQGELLRGAVVAAFEHLEERQQQGVVVGGFGHPQIRDGLPKLGALPRVEVLDEGVRGGAGGDEVFLPAAPGPGVGGVLHRPGRQEPGIVGNREVVGYDEFVDQGMDVSVAATLQQSCDEVTGPFRTVAGQPRDQPISGDDRGPLQPPDLLRGKDGGALRRGGADRRGQQGQAPPLLILSQVSTQGGDGLAECCPDRRTVCLGEIVEDCGEVFKRLRLGYQSGQGVGIPSHGMNLSAMGGKLTHDPWRGAGRLSAAPPSPSCCCSSGRPVP